MFKVWVNIVGPVKANCYIIADSDTKECAIIDPGADAPRLLRLIRQESLSARYIFLTHGHFDHIMAADSLRQALGVPVIIHKDDAGYLSDPKKSLSFMSPEGPEVFSADITVTGGETFPLGQFSLKWLHTPGHTPGSCCVIVGDRLFTGDTLFENGCGRCDLPGGNQKQLLKTLKQLSELEGDYTVYPGHDRSTTLERERETNIFIRESLEDEL